MTDFDRPRGIRTLDLMELDGLLKYLNIRRDVTAESWIHPEECGLIVDCILQLRAANFTLSQALSEIDD